MRVDGGWFEGWNTLGNVYQVPLVYINVEKLNIESVLHRIKKAFKLKSLEKLHCISKRFLYKDLDPSNIKYINSKVFFVLVESMFKARCELIYLNKCTFDSVLKFCSLYNWNEEADVKHFMEVCSILTSFRIELFKKKELHWIAELI